MKRNIGIVFVHGIVGNNRIFDVLGPLVPEDCKARYVELKGHGGDALGFSRASMSEWRAQAREAIAELSGQCENIVGVGHSMGCLLLMEQAAQGALAGLFLLNPPLRLRLRQSLLSNVLKVATGRVKDDPMAQAAQDAYGISIDLNPWHYYGWPRRYLELFQEMRRVRKTVLSRIKCPITALLSVNDEMASLSSAREFEKLPNASTILLPASTHFYYSPDDRERIRVAFTSSISN